MGQAKRRQEAARALVSQFGDRFWEKVEKTDNCWLWSGAKNRHGYGIFTIDNKQKLAHRIAYFLTRGPLPPSVVLMHVCDNPLCVNPPHLVPGTNQQNMQDMLYKGRDPRGKWRKTMVSVQGPTATEQNGIWRFRVRIERPNRKNTGFDYEFNSRSKIIPTSLQVLKQITQIAFGARDPKISSTQMRLRNALQRKLNIIFGNWYSSELTNCIRAGNDTTHILRKFLQEDSPHTSRRLIKKDSEQPSALSSRAKLGEHRDK